MAGLLYNGFDKKTLAEALAELKSDLWSGISDQLNLSSAAPLGNILGSFSERIALIWDLGEAVYNARRSGAATGAALTALSLLTGTSRRAATETTVTVTVNLDDGFSQAAGTMVAHKDGDPTARFVNVDLVENTSGITDDFDVEFEAETAGALECASGELTEIAEPITGWNSVTNALDGVTGFDDEVDEDLRLRREEELTAQGSSTADALRSDVLDQLGDNITHCRVLENYTPRTDANGLPPNSVEVIARGLETDAAESTRLATLIMREKAGGIQAYGSESENVTDSQGNVQSIGYSWVDELDVHLEVDLEIDEDVFPDDGDDQVKAAIADIEDSYEPGSDVIAQRVAAACFSVAGVVDVPAVRLGFSASPVGTTNLAISVREFAALDTSRIEVAHV